MSELHCNFMINTGNATAADLEALGEEVRRRVKETSGVELRWEIKRIGNAGIAIASHWRLALMFVPQQQKSHRIRQNRRPLFHSKG
jgi:hypothetical protein